MRRRRDDRSQQYLSDVVALLWPEPWRHHDIGAFRVGRRQRAHPRAAYVFPHTRRPRMLVPADLREAAQMLRRSGGNESPLRSALDGALVRVVKSPVFAHVPWPSLHMAAGNGPEDSIESYLHGVLEEPVRVGVLLGTPRPNQKPVLQLFDLEGRTVGYAKVGHTPATAELVRREARALAQLGSHELDGVVTPRLLHHGQWKGVDVVVMSSVSSGAGSTGVPREVELQAMRQVASFDGTRREQLQLSSFWARLRDDVQQVQEPDFSERLTRAFLATEQAWGSVDVEFGAWHGDWAPWNMSHRRGLVEIWDWERFDPDVPLGLDLVHLLAQAVRPSGPHFESQEDEFLASVPTALPRVGVADHLSDLTLVLYLLEIGSRYALAGPEGRTAQTTTRLSWVVSLLERLGPGGAAPLVASD